MADPTVLEVLTVAQGLTGDTNGDIYTSSFLTPHFDTAMRDLYAISARWKLPAAGRDAYYVLPQQTNRLSPTSAGIDDLGEPVKLWERGGVSSVNITSVSNDPPMVVTTATPHGYATFDEVDINKVATTIGVNTKWIITVLSPTTFSLNGSIAGGIGSGGTVAKSAERFVEMSPIDSLPQNDQQSKLIWWRWIDDAFEFVGSTEDRQLWIEYETTGTPPTSGKVGFDNSKDYLAYRTAGLAMGTRGRGANARSLELLAIALGPNMEPDGTGGMLRNLVIGLLKEKQKRAGRRLPFRRRRSIWLGYPI